MVNKSELTKKLRDELESGQLRKEHFPMLTDYGVRDYSETVHTAGLNYITQIGRSLNDVIALSEYPIFGEISSYPAKKTREVRIDSIWFSKTRGNPLLVCEFERYEKNRQRNQKLQEKIENLLIAYHQLGAQPPLILFIYWTYQGDTVAADIERFIKVFDQGFKLRATWIPGINAAQTDYIVYQAVASGDKECLKFNHWIRVK